MGNSFDPTLSPYDEGAVVPDVISPAAAPINVPMNLEVKRLIVAISKGVRDAQSGYDKTIENKPAAAASFQKNMIALLRLQLDAIRMNYEMHGGKLSPQATSTVNQTVVMSNDTRQVLADLLSGHRPMGASAGVAVAEPLAGNGG